LSKLFLLVFLLLSIFITKISCYSLLLKNICIISYVLFIKSTILCPVYTKMWLSAFLLLFLGISFTRPELLDRCDPLNLILFVFSPVVSLFLFCTVFHFFKSEVNSWLKSTWICKWPLLEFIYTSEIDGLVEFLFGEFHFYFS
jgi:hypothetical protein